MKHALGPRASALADIRRARVVLAFDFDGTLAPIVSDRKRARMRPRTRELLARLCMRYPCAVISGRSRDDVATRVAGLPLKHVVGGHGAGFSDAHPAWAQHLAVARRYLASFPPSPGIEIEDKHHSIAVHYRRAPNPRDARRHLSTLLAGLPASLRALHGKCVVDILPARAPNKGDAVTAIRALEGADRVLFVGDDRTDEDAFARTDIGIRVGFVRSSNASYFLRGQQEVDQLLAWLAQDK